MDRNLPNLSGKVNLMNVFNYTYIPITGIFVSYSIFEIKNLLLNTYITMFIAAIKTAFKIFVSNKTSHEYIMSNSSVTHFFIFNYLIDFRIAFCRIYRYRFLTFL